MTSRTEKVESPVMPGRFIVIEGPDGAGTTLHTRLLTERLTSEGQDIVMTAEPTDGAIGQWIRQILHGNAVLPASALQTLFTADRAWHVEEVILPALHDGKTVLSDRYSASTIAYGVALGLPKDWLRAMNDTFVRPDKQLFLLPSIDVCLERLGRREQRDIMEERSLQEKIHASYHALAQEDPSITVIDTDGEKAAVSEQIWQAVSPFISR